VIKFKGWDTGFKDAGFLARDANINNLNMLFTAD